VYVFTFTNSIQGDEQDQFKCGGELSVTNSNSCCISIHVYRYRFHQFYIATPPRIVSNDAEHLSGMYLQIYGVFIYHELYSANATHRMPSFAGYRN